MADTMLLFVTDRRTGAVVNDGDPIESFRGEPATLVKATRARVEGKSGKVLVRWIKDGCVPECIREYYDAVFNLQVDGLLSCGCPHSIVWTEGHQVGCGERDQA